MSDTLIRHLISFLVTLAALMIFWAAYVSGARGWWGTVIGLVVVYAVVYKLVEV